MNLLPLKTASMFVFCYFVVNVLLVIAEVLFLSVSLKMPVFFYIAAMAVPAFFAGSDYVKQTGESLSGRRLVEAAILLSIISLILTALYIVLVVLVLGGAGELSKYLELSLYQSLFVVGFVFLVYALINWGAMRQGMRWKISRQAKAKREVLD